jgi:hypothetical protein
MVVRLTALRACLPSLPRKIPGTQFCYTGSVGHTGAGRSRPTEKSNNLIGNRYRDLPTHSMRLQLEMPISRQFCDSFNDPVSNKTIWSIDSTGSVVVKALCYKPEGRGFDAR